MKCYKCPFYNNGAPLKKKQHMAVCGLSNDKLVYRHFEEDCRFTKSTLADFWWLEMAGYTIKQDCCCVCGKRANNQHHVPPRSAGNIVTSSGSVSKPTLTLCGSGTTGCHGEAEARRIHFKFRDNKWYFIKRKAAMNRTTALETEDGWKECKICDW